MRHVRFKLKPPVAISCSGSGVRHLSGFTGDYRCSSCTRRASRSCLTSCTERDPQDALGAQEHHRRPRQSPQRQGRRMEQMFVEPVRRAVQIGGRPSTFLRFKIQRVQIPETRTARRTRSTMVQKQAQVEGGSKTTRTWSQSARCGRGSECRPGCRWKN